MHAERGPSTPRRGLSVLIVEDEFLIAIELQSILERNDYRVLGPSVSIDKALRLLETERPDAAVLDVNVRGKLVTPVAERLRDLSIPFVLSSAYLSLDFEDSQVLLEAENIGKPIDEERLVEALDRLVG